jgi:hypothetical protein
MADKMFDRLTDWSYQRSVKQAFGFYIAMLTVGMMLAMMVAAVGHVLDASSAQATAAPKTFSEGFRTGFQTARNSAVAKIYVPLTGFVFAEILGVAILRGKRLFTYTAYINLILAGILSLLLGGIFGLIPIAFLTTRPKSAS